MQQVFDAIAQNFFWSVFFGLFGLGIIMSTIRKIVTVGSRERTRRDIAAYIAEGSMTPEDGERILSAKPRGGGGCCGSTRRRADVAPAVQAQAR